MRRWTIFLDPPKASCLLTTQDAFVKSKTRIREQR